MNAHQRRIEKRRKIRMWGKAAAEYQIEMLARGRQICELIRGSDWELNENWANLALHFNPDEPSTFEGWTWCDYATDWKPVPMTARVMLDAREHFITKKEPHE